jgi:peroxisomal 2,4-dienoyl-CoA reductase
MTSNIIAPGPIGGTEGMERLMRPEDKAEAIRNIPLQRLGSVKDIADATVYVFSETGSFVNGAHIDVDGAAWRVKASNPGSALNYPDFLLGGETVTGVKGAKAKI